MQAPLLPQDLPLEPREPGERWDWRRYFEGLEERVCEKKVLEVAIGVEDELQKHGQPWEPLPLQCMAGPAVRRGVYTTAFTWFGFLVVPFTVFSVCDCNGPYHFASYPLKVVPVIGVFLCVVVFLEFWVLSIVIVPLVQVSGPLHLIKAIPCLTKLPLKLWVYGLLLMSLLNHTDIVTNGLFFAMALKMRLSPCAAMAEFDQVWRTTISESLLRYFPIVGNYVTLSGFVWAFMWLQLFVAVVCSFPLHWLRHFVEGKPTLKSLYAKVYDLEDTSVAVAPELNFDFRDLRYAYDFVNGAQGDTRFKTLSAYCGDAFGLHDLGLVTLHIAQCNRMVSITHTRFSYCEAKVEYYIRQRRPGPAWSLVLQVIDTNILRTLLCGILESGFRTNLQGMLLNLSVKIGEDGGQTWGLSESELLASILLGIFLGAKSLYDCYCTIKWVIRSREKLTEIGDMRVFQELEWRITKKLYMMLGCAWVYFLFVAYSIARLIALFACPSHMWNLPGCATFEKHQDSGELASNLLFWGYLIAFGGSLILVLNFAFGGGVGAPKPRKEQPLNNAASEGAGGRGDEERPAVAAPAPAAAEAGSHFSMVARAAGNYVLTAAEQDNQAGTYSFDTTTGRIKVGDQVVGQFRCSHVSMHPLDFSALRNGDKAGWRRINAVLVHSSEIMREIQEPRNAGAYFVLPSQLNGAEYQHFDDSSIVRRLQDYIYDNTGGPRGQLAVHPAVGQFLLDNAQNTYNEGGVSAVADVLSVCSRLNFKSVNGYLRIPHVRPADRPALLDKLGRSLHLMRLITMEHVPATGLTADKKKISQLHHRVNVVYCSGVPVNTYLNQLSQDLDGAERFQTEIAELFLTAQYYGVLRHAAHAGMQRQGREVVYLMPLGGGVFNMNRRNIAKSISASVEMLPPGDLNHLDIRLLTFERSPQETVDFQNYLDREFQKLRAA